MTSFSNLGSANGDRGAHAGTEIPAQRDRHPVLGPPYVIAPRRSNVHLLDSRIAKKLFQNLLDVGGWVEVAPREVSVTLDKRAHNPYLVDSGLADHPTPRRAGLPEVAQGLRHASTLTTSLYAKVDRQTLRSLALPWPGGEV